MQPLGAWICRLASSLALIGLLSLTCQLLVGATSSCYSFLFLLSACLGPGLNILNPDAIFGDVLFLPISLGVAIILFEGALTLNSQGNQRSWSYRRTVSFGMLIIWRALSLLYADILWISVPGVTLFAALVVVTGQPLLFLTCCAAFSPPVRQHLTLKGDSD